MSPDLDNKWPQGGLSCGADQLAEALRRQLPQLCAAALWSAECNR